MKMSLRNAIVVVALFVVAPTILFAFPTGGGAPQPQVSQLSSFSIAVAAILSLLGL
jgi:hypothetical protein